MESSVSFSRERNYDSDSFTDVSYSKARGKFGMIEYAVCSRMIQAKV